ncbi:MAG: hypothetical protein WEC80_02450, partial [Patescibacteria group bacterium]
MKLIRNLFVLSFIFAVLLFTKEVFAETEFIKDLNNPLDFSNELEGFEESGQRQPFVLFEEAKYKIWYTSQSSSLLRIAYAESTDLGNFTTKNILNLNYDSSYHFHDPTMVKIDNQYILYFAVSKGGGNYKILRATSNDGINFNEDVTEVLTPGTAWDSKAVSGPSVIFENSLYYMFYTGWNGSEWRAGLATSSDGITWSKCDNNPILASTSGPTIIKESNKYFLYSHNSFATLIEKYETSDTLSCNSVWSDKETVVIRDREYDSKLVTDPTLLKIGSFNHLFYSGLSASNSWTINLASTNSGNHELEKEFFVLIPG